MEDVDSLSKEMCEPATSRFSISRLEPEACECLTLKQLQ